MTDEEMPPTELALVKTYPCLKCDRIFETPQGLNVHSARKHGNNWSGAPKRSKKIVDRLPVFQPKPPPKPLVQDYKEVQGFKLLEDKDGHIWLAERIK